MRILDRAASTELEFELHNPSTAQQEAVLLLPLLGLFAGRRRRG